MEEKKVNLKKIINILMLLIMSVIGVFFVTGCSCTNKFYVNVVFKDVDRGLKLKDYKKFVEFKGSCDISFNILEGYDHTSMTAKLVTMDGNNIERDIEYEMTLVDPTIEVDEEHLYSVERIFTYKLRDINRSLKLVIQMADVKLKQFDIELSGVDTADYSVVKVNYNKDEYLTTFNNSILTEFSAGIYEKSFKDNKVTVDYGTCVAILSKASKFQLLDQFYGDPTYFKYLNQFKINSQLVSYNISKRGNSYYQYTDTDVFKKIYFIGDVKEDLVLSKNIPGYEEESGFKTEKNPNTFSLFTPLTSTNSDTFSLEIFSTSEYLWAMEEDGETPIKKDKITTLNEDGETTINLGLVAPSSIYNRKYDVYNLYIGDDIENDRLVSGFKNTLLEDIYIKIDCEEDLKDILNILLIGEEKQKVRDSLNNNELIVPQLKFDVLSSGGKKYAKLNSDILKDYIIKRPYELDGEIIEYSQGNCILYPEYSYLKRKSETSLQSKYFRLSISLAFKDGVDYDGYNVIPYLLDSEGNKDYGLIDYHDITEYTGTNSGFIGRIGNVTYFNKDKFERGKIFFENVYVNIYGPKYTGIQKPLIQAISLLDYSTAFYNNVYNNRDSRDDNDNYDNIIEDIKLDRIIRKEATGFPFVCAINPSANVVNNYSISCEYLTLPQDPNQIIYYTTQINEISEDKLKKLYYANNYIDSVVGGDYDFYYATSMKDQDFDIYYIEKDGDGNNITTVKISETYDLLDIAGRQMRVSIAGRMYNLKIKYITKIYETPIDNQYYAIAAST